MYSIPGLDFADLVSCMPNAPQLINTQARLNLKNPMLRLGIGSVYIVHVTPRACEQTR